VDHRGDIYAVGVLLFKMLTGYLPFESATTVEEILRSHLEKPPPRFAEVGAANRVPAAVETVVHQCLAKHPRERPQSAIELVYRYEKALGRKILEGDPIPGTLLPASAAPVRLDARTVMDCLEAWMPEPIAVIKLRGFAHDMGGEFIESEPGVIRFRLPDPTCPVEQPPQSLFALLTRNKKLAAPAEHILVELQMEKKGTPVQNILQMTVMMRPQEQPHRLDDRVWRDTCQQICRNLRAYLISR
jgi:serine/threonine-protein kinase